MGASCCESRGMPMARGGILPNVPESAEECISCLHVSRALGRCLQKQWGRCRVAVDGGNLPNARLRVSRIGLRRGGWKLSAGRLQRWKSW